MKKSPKLWLLIALFASVTTMKAIPAHPGPTKVQQPDGSWITIVLHGDEWRSYSTTEDGYTVVKNSQGYYVYAQREQGKLKATDIVVHDASQRQATEKAFLSNIAKCQMPDMSEQTMKMKQMVEQRESQKRANRRAATQGRRALNNFETFKGLIILVEWKDKSFSREDYSSIIKDMVNKEGYTGFDNEKYTGSVCDYFNDNSNGLFKPNFDVVGPYQVNYSQYDPAGGYNYGDDKYDPAIANRILNAAVDAADADVDFSQYDLDGDGFVDLVYFIFAGNGAHYSGNDKGLWWPHRSNIYNSTTYFYLKKDHVYLRDYASSVELAGFTKYPSTIKIEGIGTICHEFSHVLGLPDFYDTDYDENGQSNTPDVWSLMAHGSYCDNARTPVGYSLYERWAVGFCDAPEVVTEGSKTLTPLYQNQQGFLLKTPNKDEYFLLENRQKDMFKWDAYLPGSGMLVTRVEDEGSTLWKNNKINCYADHNYYEIVCANGTSSQREYDVFPSNGKTELSNSTSPANIKTWDGKNNTLQLTNIEMDNGIVTFDASPYKLTALAISPTEITELQVGTSQQLLVEATPQDVDTQLTWTSSDATVATVTNEGLVTGVNAGTCVITVKDVDGVQATCNVTVKESPVFSIADFKKLETGSKSLLQLTEAEVLAVCQTTAYVRDASGCIMLANMDLNLMQNDRVSGKLMAQANVSNNMPQALGTETTSASALTITAGSEVIPREVTLADLTEADYSDYVLVKAAKLMKDNGAWAVDDEGNKIARLNNTLQMVDITLNNYDGKYYDIPAIYGTNVLNNEIINELYLLASPTLVEEPSGIMEISASTQHATTFYNLNGQRVGSNYKGIIIINGKKMMKK